MNQFEIITEITRLATDVHRKQEGLSWAERWRVHPQTWWTNRADKISNLLNQLQLPIDAECKVCLIKSWCTCPTAEQKLAKTVQRFFDAQAWCADKLHGRPNQSETMSLWHFMNGDMDQAQNEAR